jgi:hypothetical protein
MRKHWIPEVEKDEAGFLNGCLPQDGFDLETVETLEASAVSFSTLYTSGNMPILKWDTAFEAFLDQRGSMIEDMMLDCSRCVLPWEVLKNLPKPNADDILYFSQQTRPSCMGHADDFAYRSSLLSLIGLGAPLIYKPTNPYVTWFLSKDGSENGGQSPAPMAKAANEHGHFLMSEVGMDNTRKPKNYERYNESAKRHQSGIIFVPGSGAELADRICRVNRAGLGVALGNSRAVSGTVIDENDVEIAVLGGSWAHATSFNAWMVKNGRQYVFWTNSHGKRYTKSTFGEPEDGAWMRTDKELIEFIRTATKYGQPYAVIPEAVWTQKNGLKIAFTVPFPDSWKS